MNGHLHLDVSADVRTGRSFVRAQSTRAPMHLGKGHWDGDARELTVFAVNATAGLFAGDVVDWRVNVATGARLRIVGPSATRVHRAARSLEHEREEAVLTQCFHVAAGAALEVWPEWFIPQAGSRCQQTTRIEVAGGGRLLFCEGIAPGRVAMGEKWAFESLRWSTDIVCDGRPVVRERWNLEPSANPASIAGWREAGLAALGTDAAFYGTVFVITPDPAASNPAMQSIHDLQDENERPAPLWVGVSRLAHDAGWMVKVLARDGAILRKVLAQVRERIRAK